MKKLIYYTPSRFNNLKYLPDIKIWLAIFKIFREGISFVDRSEIIKTPIQTATLDHLKIPVIDPSFNMGFDQCAIDRATEIYQQHLKLGVPIRLSWSGGIDSTAALVAFIKLLGIAESKRCLEIVMTSAGIVENPYVWEKIIRKENFTIVNTAHTTSSWDANYIITNGEGGDQVQGGDILRQLIRFFGSDALKESWTRDKIIHHVRLCTDLADNEIEFLSDLLIDKVIQAPIKITSLSDFWWWLNFSCKWASTFYRLITKSSVPVTKEFIDTHYYPFYNSKNFQLWSMLMRHEAHSGDWVSYKWKAREFICNEINSPQYSLKHRQGSLFAVLAHTHKSEAIDDDFTIYKEINPEDWYTPDNSFRITT